MNNDLTIASRAKLFFLLKKSHQTFSEEITAYSDFHNAIPTDIKEKHEKIVAKQLLYGLLSALEVLFTDSANNLLISYPGKITSQKTDADLLTRVYTLTSAIRQLSLKQVNELSYKRPIDFLAGIYKLFGEEIRVEEDTLGTIIEAKATRDVYMHNNGKANFIYREKAGKYSRDKSSDSELKIDDGYLVKLKLAIETLGSECFDHCIQKHKNDNSQEVFKSMWNMSSLSRLVPFDKQWRFVSNTVHITDYQWAWSHSEQALFNFFHNIYGGGNREKLKFDDIPYALERWRGSVEERLIESWLEDPFYL